MPEFNEYERKEDKFQTGLVLELKKGDIVHKFEIEREVDMTGFSQGVEEMVEDIKVNDLSGFALAARHLTVESVRFQIEITDDRYRRYYLEEILKSGRILPLSKNEINSPSFYHAGCSVFSNGEVEAIDKVNQMRNSGIYGSKERVGYFSNEEDEALFHGLGNYNEVTQRGERFPEARILFLVIDAAKLLEKRNVFIDPESLFLGNEHEFNKNFIVHKGVPVSSIKGLWVLRYKGF